MEDALRDRIQRLVDASPVVLFMKGSKLFPQCGFSARVVSILRELDVPFQDVNVLTDPALREGLKEFSSWPTFPQLYVRGELVGGADIVGDLYSSGQLGGMLADAR